MKIRPLHKTPAGNYRSDCGNWLFVKKIKGGHTSLKDDEGWYAYQRMADNRFHKDTPYFFYPYRTREELIKAVERIK